MAGILAKIRRALGLAKAPPPRREDDVRRIRAAFHRRHTNFRLLLTAGKRVVSTLADMERARTDGRVFGMAFLRAGATTVLVNAFRMLNYLEALAPQSAANLRPRFRDICGRVEEVLGRRRPLACGRLVDDLSEVDAGHADYEGSRLAELGEVKNRLGLPVPPGFVIGACAYEAFLGQPGLREEMARRIQCLYAADDAAGDDAVPTLCGVDEAALAAMSREIGALIMAAPMPPELERAILAARDGLLGPRPGTRLCIIPVSLGEGQGFTGDYPAQYAVAGEDVLSAYRRAVAGKFSPRAMARRLSRGIPDIDVTLCVGVLAVPATGRRGTCRSIDPAEAARTGGLDAAEAARLADLARRLAAGLGAPVRFEWLEDADGAFAILRCGPEPAEGEDDDALREAGAAVKPAAPQDRRSHMEGTPVHRRLCDLLEVLEPLTLPPPEDPGFRSANCRTARDVARLAHQRAVDAMFAFGRGAQDFPEGQAKQLWAGGAAMHWWVINLEDAFTGPAEGKFIRLENIDSPPFQAVWQGISAVPWEGPPAVDAKGLLSILFESTTNPELTVTGDFDFGVQNHILLSRAYLSLSSRFGYHFVTIEAFVGGRARENYVSFQFHGGAAEITRRERRIAFVSGILAEFGFSREVRGDALVARVEGLTTAEFLDRLRVLGYLLIHTRQLDMIMGIPARVRLQRGKIMADLAAMLAKPHPGGAKPRADA